MNIKNQLYSKVLLAAYACIFVWSAIHPRDYQVWTLEIIGVLFLIAVYIIFHRKIRFSGVTNTWFFIAASLITIGAHFSFPHVPSFEHFGNFFGLERNNYDKIGHVVQGILPVLITWDVIVKNRIIRNFFWINFFSFNLALSISACYELFEWLFIVVLGDNDYTYDVLGTQGYIWDAQSDMLCALIGAILTIVVAKRHLRKLMDKFFPQELQQNEKLLLVEKGKMKTAV